MRYLILLLILPQFIFAELCNISNPLNAGPELRACISNTSDGVVEALPGTYILQDRVPLLNKTLTTFGRNRRCKMNTAGCAEFKVSANYTDIDGAIALTHSGAHLKNVRVNGNKEARRAVIKNVCRKPWDHRYGIGVLVSAPNTKVSGTAIYEVPCGTGLEVWKQGTGTDNVTLKKLFVKNNGSHDKYWADGVTIHGLKNSTIVKNKFVGNTDIDLIFGGCINCLIAENKVKHNEDTRQGAFAGIMFHAWTGTADFTGTIARDNKVDCGSKALCGFGTLIGSNPWRDGTLVTGLRFDYNEIKNAQFGLVVTEDTQFIALTDNNVQKNYPSDKKFATTCNPIFQKGSRYMISPNTGPGVNYTYLIDGKRPKITTQWDQQCIPGIYQP